MLTSDLLTTVHGYLSAPEAELLYRLASEVPAGSNVVEIGSYQGRSTVALAMGARLSKSLVWAIDPHFEHLSGIVYSMIDNQRYVEAIAKYGLGDIVKTINLTSRQVADIWIEPISLLWIDGSHEYDDVKSDFVEWSRFVDGKIAFHDSNGHYPGVSQVLDEILTSGQWERVEVVDAISVLRCMAK